MDGIRISQVSKKYVGQIDNAVNHIDLTIPTGSITGLLGPNGAGKTTLVLMICGLLKPDNGDICIVKEGKQTHIDKRFIGFVPQQDGLFGELTLQENLWYFGRLYGLERVYIQQRIRDLAGNFQLSAHLDKRVKHLSGGMNRRANILVALLHSPDILILDEPTAGVDIHSRALIHELIRELNCQGKTILYTSHLLAEAQELCQIISIMDYGRLILSGSPEDLLSKYKMANLEELFIALTGKAVRD
ncbi:MAG: ABC transporter ATP-binding protein [Saprospiraceae bacterium]|nr:ABC transporter ATP-binding protein [Saprospiraceae bacterium]